MLRRQAWVGVIACYVLFAFAYVYPDDFRSRSPAFVFGGWMAFLIRALIAYAGWLLLLVAGVAALRRARRLLAATVPVLLFALGPTLWQYRPKTPPTLRGAPLTVMSVNLLVMNENTGPIIEEIRAARPDVLLLQEYTHHWHEAIREAVGENYPFMSFVAREDSFGAAIYSRLPFREEPRWDLALGETDVPEMRAVLAAGDRSIAVYNIHLLPAKNIRYTTATRRQFADLANLLGEERLPLILAGDFNFTERCPQAAVLRAGGLNEAHELGGRGPGATWPVISFFRYLPGIRIDHIYLKNGLSCTRCETGVGVGSDHRPVIARIGFEE
ncbi:MAG: endonuclease/exonuclease/phosphatase family protein [Phycisphaerae bacterium]